MKNSHGTIEVGTYDQTVLVRVKGRGLFHNSQALKKYVNLLIDSGYRTVVIDARDCDYMDSSFLGTLTGFAIRLKKQDDGRVEFINMNDTVKATLHTIGLNHVFRLSAVKNPGPIATVPLALEELSKRQLTEFLLEAHENLIAADTGNAERFRNVREALLKELKAGQPEKI
jgi:anti-sigma B factor antagonist